MSEKAKICVKRLYWLLLLAHEKVGLKGASWLPLPPTHESPYFSFGLGLVDMGGRLVTFKYEL
jgi:hypothetical protein